MPFALAQDFDALIEGEIAATPGAAPGSLYDQRFGDAANYPTYQYVPHCIYFFYMRFNTDGSLKIDHYFYTEGQPDDPMTWPAIPYASVPQKIEYLANNARPSGARSPQCLPSHNFEGVKFRRKSYVAFFLDEQHWSFHKRQLQNNTFAIAYNQRKAGNVPNSSFFDAMNVEFLMENSSGGQSIRTGVVLMNHMKNAAGQDLPAGAPLQFAFDMYFNVKFVDPSNQKMAIIFDPGGTNQGPPLQP